MNIKSIKLVALITLLIVLVSNTITAQSKIYHFEDGEKYYIIELDTNKPETWGTYRALHHHRMPYFEMTFISAQQQTANDDVLMTIVPTFYAYSYSGKIQGIPDTLNTRTQEIKFNFRIKDKGKTLEFIKPDSLTSSTLLK